MTLKKLFLSICRGFALITLTFIVGPGHRAWAQAIPAQPARPVVQATGDSASPQPSSAPPAMRNYVFLNEKQDMAHEGGKGSAPNDSTHQGVRMHGHWVIDIKDSDGTLAQHHEFENALVANGVDLLTGLLGGAYTHADYMVILQASPSTNGVCSTAANSPSQQCALIRTIATFPATYQCYQGGGAGGPGYPMNIPCFTGLTINYTVDPSGTLFTSMVLAGSFVATNSGTIGQVATGFASCISIPPSQCLGNFTFVPGIGNLSVATPPQITVNAGQLVQVTVTITFS
jgi:hypothetical protein